MAVERYFGSNCSFAVDSFTVNFKEFGVEITSVKATATAADSPKVQRGTKQTDAKITAKGFNGNSSRFADLAALVNQSPSAITYDADGSSNLPADFFTTYPLANWVIDDVSTNQTEDPSEWTMTLTPNNIDR
jgi:hypothetical protein